MEGGAELTVEQRRLSDLKGGDTIAVLPEAGEALLFDSAGERL